VVQQDLLENGRYISFFTSSIKGRPYHENESKDKCNDDCNDLYEVLGGIRAFFAFKGA
jgi:hypothetical protein